MSTPSPSATQAATVAVSGATGLVGSAVVAALGRSGYRVKRLVRRPPRDPAQEIFWSVTDKQIDEAALAGVEAVVHLAGENISEGRWTDAKKRRIRDSRVEGTRLLAEAIARLKVPPRVFASASAIGYYGNRGDAVMDESSALGEGFLAEVCRDWEAATQPARDAGVRVANLRIGVVISREGGPLARMLPPFKLGLGGVIGSGAQYLSWIDLEDLVAAILHVLATESLSGPVNLVAPQPVTNREFTKALGKMLYRPTVLPLPAFAARLAFGEVADELLLSSTRVEPRRLLETGFQFRYPSLESALRHMLARRE